MAEHVAIWKDKAPAIFTTKKAEAVSMTAALEDAAKRQEAGLGGVVW